MFVRAPAFALVVLALVAVCSANISEDATTKAAAPAAGAALAPASDASVPAVLAESSLQTVERRKRHRKRRYRKRRYNRKRRHRRRYGRKRRYRHRYGRKRYYRRKSYDDDYDYGSHSKDDYYYNQYPEGCDSRCYPYRAGCPSHCALSPCGGGYSCKAKLGANAPLCGGRCVYGQAALVAQCGAGTCMPAPCPQPGYYFCLPKPVAPPTDPCGPQVCYSSQLTAAAGCTSSQCEVRPCRTNVGGTGHFCGAKVASVCGDICIRAVLPLARRLCLSQGCAVARCGKGVGFKCVEAILESPLPSPTTSATPSTSPPAVDPDSLNPPTSPAPTVTPSVTPTPGASVTSTPSATPTPTGTPVESLSPTPSATASPSVSTTASASVTPSPSIAASVSSTPSPTPSPAVECPNCYINNPDAPTTCIPNTAAFDAGCNPCDANANGTTGNTFCARSGLPDTYDCCPNTSVCRATITTRFNPAMAMPPLNPIPDSLICSSQCGSADCDDLDNTFAQICRLIGEDIPLVDDTVATTTNTVPECDDLADDLN